MAHRSILTLAILFAIAIGTPTSHSHAASNVPSCVQSHAHARYLGFAWDHIASIDNLCEKTAACTVTTHVNPDPIDVTGMRGRFARSFGNVNELFARKAHSDRQGEGRSPSGGAACPNGRVGCPNGRVGCPNGAEHVRMGGWLSE